MSAKLTTIDRLRALADEEKMRAAAVEWILDLGDLSDLAEALAELAEAIPAADQEVQAWTWTGGADKADQREAAIEAVQRLVAAWDAVDLCEIPDPIRVLLAGAGPIADEM